MERAEQAADFMRSGFNCAQSVMKTFASELGLPEEAAVKMAAPFGGGMGRNGCVCGAVSGAACVLGARYGFTDPTDTAARLKAYAMVTALIERFKQENGSMMCRDLLGIDPKEPGDWDRATAQGVFRDRCPLFVCSAAKIVEDLLKEG
ncbi:MAG: C_GCAxxG_C_C family protein [Anaerolineales bacterium]|nr:C_GCAxxG_C_C family protein [Anaerolineales bacterium]